ncbi:hypothetical protein SUGI_0972450 [Cryptomeria japonica]|nr:hypothetical protein SUGI_0972450 [Cryptomeria japonica]
MSQMTPRLCHVDSITHGPNYSHHDFNPQQTPVYAVANATSAPFRISAGWALGQVEHPLFVLKEKKRLKKKLEKRENKGTNIQNPKKKRPEAAAILKTHRRPWPLHFVDPFRLGFRIRSGLLSDTVVVLLPDHFWRV